MRCVNLQGTYMASEKNTFLNKYAFIFKNIFS